MWRIPLGDGFGQITVADDKVVIFAEKGPDEFVFCLDAATGKEIWSVRIDRTLKDGNGNGPRSTPTVVGNRVYIYSTFMKLLCLDLADGKALWRHDLVAEHGADVLNWGNSVSPIVEKDLVIVPGGEKGKSILAFDTQTGKLRWSTGDGRQTHATPTVATIHGVRQVICFLQSGLVSVDPETGKVLWSFAHPYRVSTAASPVVGGRDGDIVYCSAGYGIGAAACRVTRDGDRWSAKEPWRTPGKNLNHWSTPVSRDGYLYGLFGHNDRRGPLACLDMETGAVKWTRPGFGSQGAIIRLADNLLVQTPTGDLVLVAASPDAFKELGRTSILKGKNWTSPGFSRGMIFARNTSAKDATSEGVCLKLK